MEEIGTKPTEVYEDIYNGPMVGYTNREISELMGNAVLRVLEDNDLQIVWKRKDI